MPFWHQNRRRIKEIRLLHIDNWIIVKILIRVIFNLVNTEIVRGLSQYFIYFVVFLLVMCVVGVRIEF